MARKTTGALTPMRAKVLRFVAAYLHREGFAPTLREIGEGIGLGHRQAIGHLLRPLLAEGYLENTKGDFRSLRVGAAGAAWLAERDAVDAATPPGVAV